MQQVRTAPDPVGAASHSTVPTSGAAAAAVACDAACDAAVASLPATLASHAAFVALSAVASALTNAPRPVLALRQHLPAARPEGGQPGL